MTDSDRKPNSIFAPISGPVFTAPELPTYEALMDCIRCGRCLPACPTYQQTTLETFSPRGRLSLMRAVEDGKLDLAVAGVVEHLYHCLDCRACNTVCPVSIPIGELIVEGRAAVEAKHPRHWLIRLILNHALISPRRIQWFTPPLRWAQHLKLDRLGVALLGWIPRIGPVLKDLVQLAPKMPKPLWGELQKPDRSRQRSSSTGNSDETCQVSTYRVGFFLGCVMNVAFADASRATVELLHRFNCEVITPNDQMCCGAPQDDQGLKDTARKMAKRNIAAFEALGDLDAIVADCAACSGFLKEYERVFHNDAEWSERASRFSNKVRDITEWLDQIMPADLKHPERSEAESKDAGDGKRASTSLHSAHAKRAPVAQSKDAAPQRITYHEPCHLANVQGVRRQPRAVLARLKPSGVEMCELADSTRCCGSAGIYNLTHPALSKELLDRKMADVEATGAEVVVSANPGCLLQLEWGARRTGSDVKVKHVTQMVLETIERQDV
ncbi:MAG: (Fe-S)-binding protein [Chloroflexi bacterium]|nr:(Fe-S)-binding protein [Chloroflexota bacterium]